MSDEWTDGPKKLRVKPKELIEELQNERPKAIVVVTDMLAAIGAIVAINFPSAIAATFGRIGGITRHAWTIVSHIPRPTSARAFSEVFCCPCCRLLWSEQPLTLWQARWGNQPETCVMILRSRLKLWTVKSPPEDSHVVHRDIVKRDDRRHRQQGMVEVPFLCSPRRGVVGIDEKEIDFLHVDIWIFP